MPRWTSMRAAVGEMPMAAPISGDESSAPKRRATASCSRSERAPRCRCSPAAASVLSAWSPGASAHSSGAARFGHVAAGILGPAPAPPVGDGVPGDAHDPRRFGSLGGIEAVVGGHRSR